MTSTALTVRSDTSSAVTTVSSGVSNVHRGWENAEFPIVCERCFGDNPYIRMQVDRFGGTCKMCERPFSLFKWRPGRKEGYKKTEVCQACARLKNLCQCCILDMQLGLPAQLRDAVLQHSDGILSAETQKNRDYMVQQQLARLDDSGEMLGEDENEKLLQIARSATENREQPRVKLIPGKPQTAAPVQTKEIGNKRKASELGPSTSSTSINPAMALPPPLPPGITDVSALSKLNMNQLPDHMKAFLNQHFAATGSSKEGSSEKNDNRKQQTNTREEKKNSEPSAKSVNSKKIKAVPRPPPGPPPPSAFLNTNNNASSTNNK